MKKLLVLLVSISLFFSFPNVLNADILKKNIIIVNSDDDSDNDDKNGDDGDKELHFP